MNPYGFVLFRNTKTQEIVFGTYKMNDFMHSLPKFCDTVAEYLSRYEDLHFFRANPRKVHVIFFSTQGATAPVSKSRAAHTYGYSVRYVSFFTRFYMKTNFSLTFI